MEPEYNMMRSVADPSATARHEKSSSEILKCYLDHLGLYRKKKRCRCLSAELYQLATINTTQTAASNQEGDTDYV